MCLAATFFDIFNIPVFWPVLLFYFVFVSITIALRQHRHMQKYGYSLQDFFKKKESPQRDF